MLPSTANEFVFCLPPGYVWLTRTPGAAKPNLEIQTTHDEDSPVFYGLNPILVLDMWEHAWYLKHIHNKAEYIKVGDAIQGHAYGYVFVCGEGGGGGVVRFSGLLNTVTGA